MSGSPRNHLLSVVLAVSAPHMINHLNIKNFAIISNLSLAFEEGLNILTGETGAGKSIILNSANLVLGGRPSADLIRTGEDTLEVEASFFVEKDSPVLGLLEQWGLEPSQDLIIRRAVTKKGPNKVFINGALGSVAMLAELGPHIMTIVGQYDQRILTQPETHVDLLDEFAGLGDLRTKVESLFEDLARAVKRKRSLLSRQERDAERLELLRFQIQEIDAAALSVGEDEELGQERNRLRNAEKLNQIARTGHEEIYGSDQALVARAGSLQSDLEKAGGIDPELKSYSERLKSAILELEDVAFGLREYAEKVVFDPERLEWVESRLAAITKLSRKYGQGTQAILTHRDTIADEIEALERKDLDLGNLDKEIADLGENLLATAREISTLRRESAHKLAEHMERELAALNMNKLIFQTRFEGLPSDDKESISFQGQVIGPKGIDAVSFLISPNPGEEPRPMARIASGGELSRILLALKSIMAGKGEVETLVFDEVDTGIGGETAEKVGLKLLELSGSHQIVCITHLPQIAIYGRRHVVVSKQIEGDRTATRVKKIDNSERVEEIARMLGAGSDHEKAREYALEMISRAKKKQK